MMLGEKLRKIRTAREFSLEDLAQKTNLTRSFLSQVEKNKTSPSISSLIKIATALGTNMSELFLEEKNLEKFIIHEEERESFFIAKNKIKIELLAPRVKEITFNPMFIRFGRGGETDFISASRAFFCLVLQGELELSTGEKRYILTKGDSIYLDSPLEHKWKNIGKNEVISFVVATTPMSK